MGSGEFGERSGATKDIEEHGSRETPCVRVLQRGMEAGDDVHAAWHGEFGAVAKGISGARGDAPCALHVCQKAVKGDAAEADDNTELLEHGEFLIEPWGAVAQFLRSGFIGRRRASPNRGDPETRKLHAVVARSGLWLRGEAGLVQHRIEKIAGAIARERSAGTVGAVRAGRESEDEHTGPGVAEGRHGPAPVLPVGVGAAARAGDLGAVRAQAWTELALDDAFVERLQGSWF